jgi:chaperonin GroES
MEAIQNVMDLKKVRGSISIDDILANSENVAELLNKNLLDSIGTQVCDEYEIDKQSMQPWVDEMERAIKLAAQVSEKKMTPWEGASNVKHSLILEACTQFVARALPEIIRDRQVVKVNVFGKDPDGSKAARADRVSRHMNYQLLEQLDDWEDDLDRLLMLLSMMGTVFKKAYYCPVRRKNVSEICLPDKVVVHQATASLKTARRITHEIDLYRSDVIERQRAGVFLDVDLNYDENSDEPDTDFSSLFLEQHRKLDLDGDGYPEPYIVTVHKCSKTVVRITPRFYSEDIIEDIVGSKIEIVGIEERQHFADFHFMRSMEGSFFSYGFGYLLAHGTHVINTILNQLIDAGTLSNTSGGLISKGAKIAGDSSGALKLNQGEWYLANASGVDLQQSVFMFPTKEPSGTLFSLVQFLLNSYYKLISLSDIMSGQISGSNTTAAEAMSAVEQGMKLMNSVHKRVYRGLKREFKILFCLNGRYVSDEEYSNILDEPAVVKDDYEEVKLDVAPIADASMTSQLEEVVKLRAVVEMSAQVPEINRIELGRRMLKAMRIEDIDALLPPVDPNQPTPQQQQIQEALEQKADELDALDRQLRVQEADVQIKAQKTQYEVMKLIADATYTMQKAKKEDASISMEGFLADIKALEAKAKYIQAITPDRGKENDKQGEST